MTSNAKSDSSYVYYEKMGVVQFDSRQCIISDTSETFNSIDIFDRIKSGGGKDPIEQSGWLYLDNIEAGSIWTSYLKINGLDDSRLELIIVNDDYVSHDDPNDMAFYAWMTAGHIHTDVSGVVGIFDLKHFDDDDLIATLDPTPQKGNCQTLWFRYVGKVVEASPYECAVVPYGVAIGELPDRVRLEVDTVTDLINNMVIGIKIYLYPQSLPVLKPPTLKLTLSMPFPTPKQITVQTVPKQDQKPDPEFLVERLETKDVSKNDMTTTLDHLFNKGVVYIMDKNILKVI